MNKQNNTQALGQILLDYEIKDDGKYITQEFQDYGYRLAVELDDLAHKALYIKMAKAEDRSILDAARRFVIDADSARSKGKLFMWKFKQLKDERGKVSEGSK